MKRQGRDYPQDSSKRSFGGSRDDSSSRSRPSFGERGASAGPKSYGRKPEGGRPSSFSDRGERSSSYGNGAGGYKPRSDSPGRYDERPPSKIFRRDDGPSQSYGRPSYRDNDSRDSRDNRDSRPTAPAARPVAAAAAPVAQPVSAERLKAGVADANRALGEVVEKFGHTLRGDYDISQLEVTVSFGQDGRFLGFGAGGAASMTLSITPLDAESVMEGEEDVHVALDDAFDDVALEDEDDSNHSAPVEAAPAKAKRAPRAKAEKKPKATKASKAAAENAETDTKFDA